MSATLILALTALKLLNTHHNYTGGENYYALPRFWTNTGFCPPGKIDHKEISSALLSDALNMQLRQIAALPTGALTHIRIHWLLELLQFMQYTPSGTPIYDFTNLDKFLEKLDDLGLSPVVEFMANPGNVFTSNPNNNDFLWSDFSYQVGKRYLNMFGAKKLLKWRFETWNEPDLQNYNRVNFTLEGYFIYVNAIRRGLKAAGHRSVNSLNFQLLGPAGLFKAEEKHPFCWHILEKCNENINDCPLDTITYHQKGNGTEISNIIDQTSILLLKIWKRFPALQALTISNDEADPIAGWSTPREFQEDVRYAALLVSIIMLHWQAKLNREEFKQLESISHDNAFLSYHPFEFSQRTMLANFRMNESQPPHSQFIQKPVYAAMGMLAKLASNAAELEMVQTHNENNILLLKTINNDSQPLFMSWLMLPEKFENIGINNFQGYNFQRKLPFELCDLETYAYIVETLVQNETDPAYVWHLHGSPAYPNAALRNLMRRRQTPRLYITGFLQKSVIELALGQLHAPWIVLLRVCSIFVEMIQKPKALQVVSVTHNEVLLTWKEDINSVKCLKSYEVWFRKNETDTWNWISQSWHLPFPSFQHAPFDNIEVNGFYKVRGVDIFNRYSQFSITVEYLEDQ